MANGYDAGSMYDVGAPQATAGLIDSGDAGMQVLQRELLRRQQFAQQQMEMQRQAALDEQNRQVQQANLELTRQQRKNQEEVGRSLIDERTAKTQKAEADAVQNQLKVGQDIPDALKDKFASNPLLGGLQLTVPGKAATPAVPAVTGQMDPDSGLPAADMQAVPAQDATPDRQTYAGNAAQREHADHMAQVQGIVDGSVDLSEFSPKIQDALKTAAQAELAGAKFQLPNAKLLETGSGGRAPTKEARLESIFQIHYDRAIAAGKSPEDATLIAEQQLNKGEATEQNNRLQVSVNAGVAKREDEQTSRAIGAAYARGMKDYDSLTGVLNRAGNLAESLAAGGGVADATAAPDFLYIMAGGFGSGVRMTDTELNRINFSRSKLSDVLIWAKGLASDRPPKLDDTQRADMNKLAAYIATRELKRAEILHAGLSAINNAKSEKEVHDLENDLKNAQIDIIGSASKHLDAGKKSSTKAKSAAGSVPDGLAGRGYGVTPTPAATILPIRPIASHQ